MNVRKTLWSSVFVLVIALLMTTVFKAQAAESSNKVSTYPFYRYAAVIEDEETPAAKPKPAKKAEEKKKESAPESEKTEPSPAAEGGKPGRIKKVASFPFYVYKDRGPGNHYIPSGWMGDYGDIKFNAAWKENPQSGDTCLRIVYSAKGAQGAGWAGMYWQYPANNWGTVDAGYSFASSGVKKVTFWARGETGNEVIAEFKVGGIQGEFSDTDVAGIGPVKLTKEWKQYSINLEGKDLRRIAGGFCWATSGDENPDGLVMYLDDIKFEQ